MIYQLKHNRMLRDVADRIDSRDGEQKLVLKSLMDKLKKMEMYRDALVNVETAETRKLFEELIVEEDNHLKMLKKALL
jgi:hypothetical protein